MIPARQPSAPTRAQTRAARASILRRRSPSTATRVSLAYVLGLPVSVVSAVTLVDVLPLPLDLRFAIGFTSCIPLWVALASSSLAWRTSMRALMFQISVLALMLLVQRVIP